MAWINVEQVQNDLVTLLTAQLGANAKRVQADADERDFHFANMPMVDVRLDKLNPEIRAGQDYTGVLTLEIEVIAHDLSRFKEAATIRHNVLKLAIDAIRANPLFSTDLLSSIVGQIEYGKVKDEGSGAFISAAVVQLHCLAYIDRS